jgi:hypothetical protein
MLLTLSSEVTLYRERPGNRPKRVVLLLKSGGFKRQKGVYFLIYLCMYIFRGLRKCLESYLTQFQQGCAYDLDNCVPVVPVGIRRYAQSSDRQHLQHRLLWLLPAAEGVLGIAAVTAGIPDTVFPPPVEGGAL